MLTSIVITVFGADRPGIVEAVAARVAANGGNWLESRLLHLGGHFAGIVRLEVDAPKREALLGALRELERDGLSVVVHASSARAPAAEKTTAPAATAAPSGERERVAATIELLGQDRPGIVREISRALASRSVNVEELATEITSAPMTGEPMFKARAEVLLPPDADIAALRHELEKIAADLMVDLSFSEQQRSTAPAA